MNFLRLLLLTLFIQTTTCSAIPKTVALGAAAGATTLAAFKLCWDNYQKECAATKKKPNAKDFLTFVNQERKKINRSLLNNKTVKAVAGQQKLLTALITTSELLICGTAISGCIDACTVYKERNEVKKALTACMLELENKRETITTVTKELTELKTTRHAVDTEHEKVVAKLKEELEKKDNEIDKQKKDTKSTPEREPSPDKEQLKKTILELREMLAKIRNELAQAAEDKENYEKEFKLIMEQTTIDNLLETERKDSTIAELEQLVEQLSIDLDDHTTTIQTLEEKANSNYKLFTRQCDAVRVINERLDTELRKNRALATEQEELVTKLLDVENSKLELERMLMLIKKIRSMSRRSVHVSVSPATQEPSIERDPSVLSAAMSPTRVPFNRGDSPDPLGTVK